MVAQIAAPRYLALALASRRVISTMLQVKKGKKTEADLLPSLRRVADSISHSRDTERYFIEPAESPFSHYEQLATLNEVLKEKRFDLTNALRRLVEGTSSREQKAEDMRQTMEFFFALENRALHYYNQQMAAGE
jgi:hypothetical protein